MIDAVPSAWNVANIVTVLRIVLVPFFAWALLADGGHTTDGRLIAAGIFVLASATDRLDGWLARRSDQVTDLGKLLDPIADKVLVGTALVLLSWLGDLPWWVTVVILVREIGITVMRFFVLRYVVIAASRGGKVKTVLQTVAIGLYLLPLDVLPQCGDRGRHRLDGRSRRDHCGHRGGLRARRDPDPPHREPTAARRRLTMSDATARCRWRLTPGRPRSHGWTVAVAESLTGGLVVAALVDVPGASAMPARGRRRLRDRPQGHAARRRRGAPRGAGSRGPGRGARWPTGCAHGSAADVGLATTGVAGPDPQDGHDPGTVHVAVSTPDRATVRSLQLAGDRRAVRVAAVEAVLRLARDVLATGEPEPPVQPMGGKGEPERPISR